MSLSINTSILVITVITSVIAFNRNYANWLLFSPVLIGRGQGWRWITHAFIHADWTHLAFNSIALWSFGEVVENTFYHASERGPFLYVTLYFSAIFIASVPDYIRHRKNPKYFALGASGAVSAVLFSSILFAPNSSIVIFPIPINIPSWLFAPLYLAMSIYLDRRRQDNIAHMAHFAGAVYGLLFTFVFFQDKILAVWKIGLFK